MSRVVLTEVDWHAIAEAAPDTTAMALARRLGKPYMAVNRALKQARSPEGWSIRLRWTTCSECGGPLASGPQRRTVHPQCERARGRRRWQAIVAQEPGRSNRYRRERHARDPAARERELALKRLWARRRAEEGAAGTGKSRQPRQRVRFLYDAAASPVEPTVSLDAPEQAAVVRWRPWSAAEDAYLRAHLTDHPGEVASALGRTMQAVRARAKALRQRADPGAPGPRPTGRPGVATVERPEPAAAAHGTPARRVRPRSAAAGRARFMSAPLPVQPRSPLTPAAPVFGAEPAHHHEPWTAAEDAYLLAHADEHPRTTAATLGRSVEAVKGRRLVLKQRGQH